MKDAKKNTIEEMIGVELEKLVKDFTVSKSEMIKARFNLLLKKQNLIKSIARCNTIALIKILFKKFQQVELENEHKFHELHRDRWDIIVHYSDTARIERAIEMLENTMQAVINPLFDVSYVAFDWLRLDLEHGSLDAEQIKAVKEMLQTISDLTGIEFKS